MLLFFTIHWSGVLTALAWLVPHETAAILVQVLCTPYNHALCHFMQSHICPVNACLAVTCHLHFWQNDRDLLCATVVTWGWKGYQNKSQHRKLTLEKEILQSLLQGFEPATFQSRVRRSNHWAIHAPMWERCSKTHCYYYHHYICTDGMSSRQIPGHALMSPTQTDTPFFAGQHAQSFHVPFNIALSPWTKFLNSLFSAPFNITLSPWTKLLNSLFSAPFNITLSPWTKLLNSLFSAPFNITLSPWTKLLNLLFSAPFNITLSPWTKLLNSLFSVPFNITLSPWTKLLNSLFHLPNILASPPPPFH